MNSDGNNTITHSPYEEGYDFFINDKWKNQFQFRISTFEVPSGLLSKAIEVTEKFPDREPHIFEVLSDFEADIEEAELTLKAKIKKNINRRHLIEENGELSIDKEDILRGRIEEADYQSNSHFKEYFVIDGKHITIEQFVELLEPYTGFNFKFKIYDPSEQVD